MSKELEALQDISMLVFIYGGVEQYKIVEKALKALEIIKEKRVNVGSFIKCCASLSYEEYKKQWSNWHKDILYNLSSELLTKEEYDLLKEVLK